MADSCLFCRMVADRREVPHWVAESERALAFLDIYPLREGHALVIPKRHARDLSEVAPEDLRAMADLAREVALRLRARLGATGENLFLASGPDAEQTVFHVHMHVVPRHPDDRLDFRGWWDPKVSAPPREEIDRLARTLRG